MVSTDEVVLEARDVVKNYGGTRALKGVNFEIRSGTVTTLFGENGAGKSTLMKILSGVEQPTSGEILLGGEPVTFSSTTEAAERGISIIHQELSLAPNLTVRDNIFMGREIMRRFGGVDFAEETRQTRALLDDMNLAIDPDTFVSDLRVGQQQVVEIARALSVNSRILIMDEPTSAPRRPRSRPCSASSATCSHAALRSCTSPTTSKRRWRSPTTRSCCATAP